MSDPRPADEAQRQQALLALLGGTAAPDALSRWLRDSAPRARRGLQAYLAHAGALAERALGAAFPTIAQLLGELPFAALARAFWQAHPPVRGDMAQWGDALPGFIAAAPDLAGEPYLADVSRLDWAVHCAEAVADAGQDPLGLERLASADPDRLWLHLAAGTVLLTSAYPVATIWLAHRSAEPDRFAPVRQALADGVGEHALVWRQGLQARVSPLPGPAAGFTQAVLAGQALGRALDSAEPGFDFQAWLLAALQQGWLARVDTQAFQPQTQPQPQPQPPPCPTAPTCPPP